MVKLFPVAAIFDCLCKMAAQIVFGYKMSYLSFYLEYSYNLGVLNIGGVTEAIYQIIIVKTTSGGCYQ